MMTLLSSYGFNVPTCAPLHLGEMMPSKYVFTVTAAGYLPFTKVRRRRLFGCVCVGGLSSCFIVHINMIYLYISRILNV